jgi:hypothetical protein
MSKAKESTPTPEGSHCQEVAPESSQVWAAARRMETIDRAAQKGSVTRGEMQDILAASTTYRDHVGEYAARDDFRALAELFQKPVSLDCTNDRVECRPRQAFADLGYGKREPGQVAIAEGIVQKHLKRQGGVFYLSTGTTVFEVAVALFDAVEKGAWSDVTVVTDNLAVVDLFCRRTAPKDTLLRNIAFTIIGGTADVKKGDVALGDTDTFAQLRQYAYSTAIVSATKVDAETGTIWSTRQPGTKQRFFKGIAGQGTWVGKLVIPVTHEKFEGDRGGLLIYDPENDKSGTERKHIIVTDSLGDMVKQRLDKWYSVEVAGDSVKASTHSSPSTPAA